MSTPQPSNEAAKAFWQFPWTYPQAIVFTTALVGVGFCLQLLSHGHGITPPNWPVNGVVLLLLLAGMLVPALRYPNNPIVRFFSTVPLTVMTIVALGSMAVMGGIFPQLPNSLPRSLQLLGFQDIFHSWPFALSLLQLIFVLGVTTFRRLLPWKSKNIPFLCYHLGVWLIVTALTFGSGDLLRVKIMAQEDSTTAHAILPDKSILELPFAVHLNDFAMETYDPHLLLIDPQTGDSLLTKQDPKLNPAQTSTAQLHKWKIEIIKYLPLAGRMQDTFAPVLYPGAVPAAQIKATHTVSGKEISGWIASPGVSSPPIGLDLNGVHLTLSQPKPRSYTSDIKLLTPDGKIRTARLGVNHPVTIAGWKLYQYSYNTTQGRWSTTSIIEAVRDPWLPFIYAGIFLLLMGMLYLFWMGTQKNQVNP
jgi:ResB-like family